MGTVPPMKKSKSFLSDIVTYLALDWSNYVLVNQFRILPPASLWSSPDKLGKQTYCFHQHRNLLNGR